MSMADSIVTKSEREMMKHAQVAMITGAASGIGQAVARQLATQGYILHLVDLNAEALQQLQLELTTQTQVYMYVGNVSDATFIADVVDTISSYGQGLDCALNNAGMTSAAASIDELQLDVWQQVLDVNLNSVFYCLKYQIQLMKQHGRGGSIVNTSSMLGLIATRHRAAYVATKHAVTGLSKAAALDGAEHQIRVNSIHPGYIETPLIAHLDAQVLAAKHPVGRLGRSEEVANLVGFLLSKQSQFVTGAQYVIDGGYSIQ